MAFLTGLMLIDAPASALNNLGLIEGSMTDNSVGVKHIRTKEGAYPYVSAQAVRYWLRQTLENSDYGWQSSPIYREKKIAYTDANPIRWWDDDLFGYMRAPSKKASANSMRPESETPVSGETITRISPFRLSTFVSVAPVILVNDFGVMARHEGDPVPHEHQFYRATLQGLMSLDLHAAGTFSYVNRTGYLNLDETRIKECQETGLAELVEEKAFRLPFEQRVQRIEALLKALADLNGGAKQTLHYTDVSPDLQLMAVTKGGNNIFGHMIGYDAKHRTKVKIDAFVEALQVNQDQIISPIYIGWVRGYLDEERAQVEQALKSAELIDWTDRVYIRHPREIVAQVVADLKANPDWLE